MKQADVLRNREDFAKLKKYGKSAGSKYVVLVYLKNGLAYNRKAFLASKKVGNAVLRNRARRLMKEAFRQTEETLPKGYDLLFIARNTIKDRKLADVKESIEAAYKRAKLIHHA